MKITIAQLNYRVGDFERNAGQIIYAIKKARAEGSDLVIFSELCVTGYPPLDLLDYIDFINESSQTISRIADECRGVTAIIGAPVMNTKAEGKKLFNAAIVLNEGRIIFQANKSLLPTYDIFDEYRYFESEKNFSIFSFNGKNIALTICEDLWDEQPFLNEFEKSRLYNVSPMDELAKLNPELIINISASPFSYTQTETRRQIFINKALKYRLPIIYVNQTGANSELIFDGGSLIIDGAGKIFRQLPFFEECISTFELDDLAIGTQNPEPDIPDKIELIYKALLTGIRDYFGKSGLNKAVLGLSGGLDSAVVLCLASASLGRENIAALIMPSRYSPAQSVEDAVKMAESLGVKYEIISIEKLFRAFEEVLEPLFKGLPADVTEENIQARIRAVLLMAYSNKFGYILLNTSNKSEIATGYGTLYGDMAGGLSVIGDVYKSDVYRLANYINRHEEIIPASIIAKPPSAELKPDQLDTDSLPPYVVLDEIIYRYIELSKSADEIIVEGFDGEIVMKTLRMINSNEYKRYQAPPILRVSSKAFGAGRKMPLVFVKK
ncbi:MAG TPA: NAD+ synthase [Bacteroidales bacterium]|nr:NAD+ synthase [Bacteroidales bacterium]HOU95557.1 NAD+ synthase [Bacteroidales bacterium]HQG36179.1 NAD+ synthase [Bacteroidales bacterium]HQG53489.1 NAD+ synthase [Bacteroidales bacterium]HQJ20284.1 NAD+ synthase [Bacteroidales bacterium]